MVHLPLPEGLLCFPGRYALCLPEHVFSLHRFLIYFVACCFLCVKMCLLRIVSGDRRRERRGQKAHFFFLLDFFSFSCLFLGIINYSLWVVIPPMVR